MVRCVSQPRVPASSAPSLFDSSLVPSTSSPTLAPSVGKAFVGGPGYAPIPGKLVAKITSGAFVELAENIRAQEAEPHTYLNDKLLVAAAREEWERSQTFLHGFRPLPFTSGSFAVLTLLTGRMLLCSPDGFSVSWTSLFELWHGIQEGCCSLSYI